MIRRMLGSSSRSTSSNGWRSTHSSTLRNARLVHFHPGRNTERVTRFSSRKTSRAGTISSLPAQRDYFCSSISQPVCLHSPGLGLELSSPMSISLVSSKPVSCRQGSSVLFFSYSTMMSVRNSVTLSDIRLYYKRSST